MKTTRTVTWKLLGLLLALPLVASAANPAFAGRWRLDPARSSALDGWNTWDLVIGLDGSRVSLLHEMQWRTSKVSAANVVDTAQPTSVKEFFRVEQRHMAVYPERGALTPVQAGWLDQERTLRVEATVPVEISQGPAKMRIYQEWRIGEGDRQLVLIELHHTRSRPLVYVFNKVTEGK